MNLDEQIRSNLERYQEQKERIRNMKVADAELGVDIDVSRQAKTRYIAELYKKAKATYDQLAAKKRAEVEANLEETGLAAFRPKVSGADPVNLQMSMRDALSRLDGVTDARALNAQLARAHQMGDTVMAKAILMRGVELGDLGGRGVVDAYLEKFPNERETYMNYVAAAEEFNRVEKFGVSGTPDEPPEMKGAGREMLRAVDSGEPAA
jgi:hypothetical protein